ncbi:MAG: hypothetical protein C0448_11985 [Sphingobacteriaceae bacterium]|nr:hypothetical protein [Sphingobacteriaceae bacterium]
MPKQIEDIELSKLDFDRENPRLVEYGNIQKKTEEELVELLCNVMAVEEIILSISKSGFFNNDPLIAIKVGDRYTVIEGNRRLAAIKVITDYKKFSAFYPSIIPEPSKELLASLTKIPVLVEQSRKDAWQFIGFKHVNGAAKWDSFAKAQYIAKVHNEFNVSLDEIALQIGDTNKIVQKLYQALMVIHQAEKNKVFDRDDIWGKRLYFSHLYTGLQYEGFREYVKLKDLSDESLEPVNKGGIENLGSVLEWLYGSKKKDQKPVIVSQNPDLRYLDAVLKNPQAISSLKANNELAYAYEISQPDDTKFADSLNEAKRALYKAQQYLSTGYKSDEPTLKLAGTVATMADELYEGMELKRKKETGADKKNRLTE